MHWKQSGIWIGIPCRKQSKPFGGSYCGTEIEDFRKNEYFSYLDFSGNFWGGEGGKIEANLKAIEKWNGILRKLLEAGAIPFIGVWVETKINSDL